MTEAETNVPRFPVPPTFHPRDWLPLQDAVLQFISLVGGKRDLGLEIVNQYLRNGQLGSVLVAPDGTPKLLEASDWGRGRRTVHAPHNPAEGVSVEPYEAGYYFVWRADFAKLTSPASEPTARRPHRRRRQRRRAPAPAEKRTRSRGPKPDTVKRYAAADRKLFGEIDRLMSEENLTLTAATQKLAEAARVDGTGIPTSRARRLAKLFKKER